METGSKPQFRTSKVEPCLARARNPMGCVAGHRSAATYACSVQVRMV
jgi:hypothetical protein